MILRLTNLLPADRVKALQREYYVRLAILVLSLGAALLVVHTILLTPAYLFISEEVETRTEHLEEISAIVDGSQGPRVEERLETLAARAKALLSLSSLPPVSKVLQEVLSVPRAGVMVTGVSFSAPDPGKKGEMRISGVAPTRDSLRRYHAALSELSFVENADLPLSVYAEEANLRFSITLTGPFLP